MQTTSQSVDIIKYVTDSPRDRVIQFSRSLRGIGALPTSIGRAVEKITSEELFGLLAATALAKTAKQAPDVAMAFRELPYEGDTSEDSFTAAWNFAQAMNPNGPWLTCRIEFGETVNGFTMVMVGEMKGQQDGELVECHFPFFQKPSWGGFSKRSFTLSKEGFQMMRNLFARDDLQGMEFK
jgi:hypothetical protein